MNRIKKVVPLLLLLVFFGLLLAWLEFTPPGLLGKLDAIGYAVCHQIPGRSFFLEERQLPLCARCSGMYLGAWVGFLYLFNKNKEGGMPARTALIPLAVLALLFIMDGINSYLTFFNPTPLLYEPQNWLRLLTGSGLGLGIAAILVPTFNQTVWIDVQLRAALGSWKPVAGLMATTLLANLALLSGNPLLTYPLAILASLSVLLVLSLAYTLVWVLVTRRENTFQTWKQVRWHLLAGLCTALLQIALIDLARFAATGTWAGF